MSAVLAPSPDGARAYRGYSSRYGRAALDSEARRLEGAAPSTRHKELFKAACRAGELVGGGELDGTLAHSVLVRAGELMKPGAHGEIERTVRQGLERGARRPRRAPSGGRALGGAMDARLAAHALLEAVAARPEEFRGVAGGSDLRVLVALALTALSAGKLRLGFSVRQLAELSGLGHSTVHRALHRLEGRWVRRVHTGSQRASDDRSRLELGGGGEGDPRLAAGEYQLLAQRGAGTGQAGGTAGGVERRCPIVAAIPPSGSINGLVHPAHDLWRRRSSAWRLYVALVAETGETRSAAELAEGLAMARRTVFRNLRWLVAVGVLEAAEGRYRVTGTAEAALERHSIPAWRELSRAGHRLDRRAHKLRLAMNACWGRHRGDHLARSGLAHELRRLGDALFEVLDERETLAARRRAEVAASTLPPLVHHRSRRLTR